LGKRRAERTNADQSARPAHAGGRVVYARGAMLNVAAEDLSNLGRGRMARPRRVAKV
jgi:hypothetical protein